MDGPILPSSVTALDAESPIVRWDESSGRWITDHDHVDNVHMRQGKRYEGDRDGEGDGDDGCVPHFGDAQSTIEEEEQAWDSDESGSAQESERDQQHEDNDKNGGDEVSRAQTPEIRTTVDPEDPERPDEAAGSEGSGGGPGSTKNEDDIDGNDDAIELEPASDEDGDNGDPELKRSSSRVPPSLPESHPVSAQHPHRMDMDSGTSSSRSSSSRRGDTSDPWGDGESAAQKARQREALRASGGRSTDPVIGVASDTSTGIGLGTGTNGGGGLLPRHPGGFGDLLGSGLGLGTGETLADLLGEGEDDPGIGGAQGGTYGIVT